MRLAIGVALLAAGSLVAAQRGSGAVEQTTPGASSGVTLAASFDGLSIPSGI